MTCLGSNFGKNGYFCLHIGAVIRETEADVSTGYTVFSGTDGFHFITAIIYGSGSDAWTRGRSEHGTDGLTRGFTRGGSDFPTPSVT